ncbi:MAG: hypothetical protein K6B65_05165 [Bacilli bacterium]|nr:hypothetical protein [Bacilli bacterium]
MECQEFVDKLNNGEILEAHFGIEGYGHYGHCKFTYTPDNSGDPHNLFLPYIELIKTRDGKEYARFHKRFNPGHKIFTIKNVNYSLPYLWKRVRIVYIRYADGREEGEKDMLIASVEVK